METCIRCRKEIPEGYRCGTAEKPYCPVCHMVVFYQFPEDRLDRIRKELGALQQMGVPQAQLDRVLWGELRRHADKEIHAKLSGFVFSSPDLRGAGR